MSFPSESLMSEQHEVLPGVFKRFGDCTARDLEGSIEVTEERIEHSTMIMALIDRLVADAEARGVSHIPVPACIRGSSRDPDLPALREQRLALEELAEELLG